MQRIQKWAADDGTEFDEADKALLHDVLCLEVASALALLPPPPSTSGEEVWIQHDAPTFLTFQRCIVELFRKAVPYLANDKHTMWALRANVPAGMTLIGRYIDDAAPRPINRAWHRVCCTDQKFREWGQPYYAIKADKLG